jgi:hypothetical protein
MERRKLKTTSRRDGDGEVLSRSEGEKREDTLPGRSPVIVGLLI